MWRVAFRGSKGHEPTTGSTSWLVAKQRSSMVEQQTCNLWVAGSIPVAAANERQTKVKEARWHLVKMA